MVVSDLNESALGALLNSPTGPVGIEVQIRAAATVAFARRNVAIITDRAPFSVEQDVDYELQADGSAIVGIRDTGRLTRYLAKKAERERDSWLVPALQESFGRANA